MRILKRMTRAASRALTPAALAALLIAPLWSPSGAQTPRPDRRDRDTDRRARVWISSRDRDDRPRLGLTTGSGGRRDTLGLLVIGVTPSGPADRAGLVEGDRIASIDGVNLRLSREDAEADDMSGVLSNRLIRQLAKKKPGDEVELRVWSEGRSKALRVKTVDADSLRELTRDRTFTRVDRDERPVLGLTLGATNSRRDTLGLMVMRVVPDGPAEKAGIVEGERIASLDGVDLRTPSEDLEDGEMVGIRISRLSRELRNLDVSKDVELRVTSARETRTVRVRPVKASSLPRDGRGAFYFGDGLMGEVAVPPVPPLPAMPRIAPMPPRVFEMDGIGRELRELDPLGDGVRIRMSPRTRIQIEERVHDAMDRAVEAGARIRPLLRRLTTRITI